MSNPAAVGPVVSIAWPARLREVGAPSAAVSATVSFQIDSSGTAIPQIIARPAGAAAVTTTTTLSQPVKPGTYLFLVNFYPDAQAASAAIAYAAVNVQVKSDGTLLRADGSALGAISASSTVANIALATGQTIAVGQTADLAVTATTTSNELVALSAGSIHFSITDGGGFLRANADGSVTGLSEGTAMVVPTVDGLSGAAVAATVTPAPLATREIDAPNNAYVYDPTRGLFWLAVPGTEANGNSVRSLNPANGVLGTPVFVGSDPSVLALSDDGTTLYAGLRGAGAVRRVDLGTMTAGLQFPLSSGVAGEPTYALDIAGQPGHPGTVALTSQDDADSGNEGPAVYDDGVVRPNALFIYEGTSLEWTAANRIVAYNGSDTGADLIEAIVDASGATKGLDVRNGLSTFGGDFVLAGGRIYDASGLIVDSATFARIGTFPLSAPTSRLVGPAVDIAANRAYFVQVDDSGMVQLRAFRLDTFIETGSRRLLNVTVSSGFGRPLNVQVFRWGTTGLALNSGARIYFVDDISGL